MTTLFQMSGRSVPRSAAAAAAAAVYTRCRQHTACIEPARHRSYTPGFDRFQLVPSLTKRRSRDRGIRLPSGHIRPYIRGSRAPDGLLQPFQQWAAVRRTSQASATTAAKVPDIAEIRECASVTCSRAARFVRPNDYSPTELELRSLSRSSDA
jgi:hypothetical protein